MKRCIRGLLMVYLLVAGSWAEAYTVGFTTHTFSYQLSEGGSKQLRVAIWYPSSGETRTVNYASITGHVVPDGVVLAGPWPLVVHSHGAWGCGVASAYLNQSLAAAGYVVAAPDHDDAAVCRIGGGTAPRTDWTLTVSRRPQDLRAVIDELFELNRTPASPFFGTIDETKVGASGHSLGGWTAGMLSRNQPNGDPRVSSLLLWSPSARLDLTFYGQLQSPVMYLFGEYDSTAGSSLFRTWAYDSTPSPKFLSYVAGATHLSFTDSLCWFYGSVSNCSSNAAATTIVRYSRAFLDRYFKYDTSTMLILTAMERFQP